MKKSDIKIGQEYLQRRGQYGVGQRVRVLGEGTITEGYGYRARTRAGTRVVILDAKTGEPVKRFTDPTGTAVDLEIVVPNREVVELWSEYAEREAKIKALRLSQQSKAEQGRRDRARALPALIGGLRRAGVEDSTALLYPGDRHLPLIQKVAPETVSEPDGLVQRRIFTAPLARELARYVESGKEIAIPTSDLLRILDK